MPVIVIAAGAALPLSVGLLAVAGVAAAWLLALAIAGRRRI